MLEVNKIHCGDCLELMKDIPDKSVDMILCDLPYGTTACSWDSIIPLDELWNTYSRIIKEKGVIILTAQTPFDKVLGYSNLKLLRYEWIWLKSQGTGHLNAKKMPLKNHENILVFYKKLPTYNPQMIGKEKRIVKRSGNMANKESKSGGVFIEIEKSEYNERYPLSVQFFKKENGLHPTQKPVALFKYLIKTYSNEGDLVLDNCIGSGTTAVACKQLNRNFIGIEKKQKYVEIANKRLNQEVLAL